MDWHIALRPKTGPLGPFARTCEVHKVSPDPKNGPNPLCTVPECPWARPWSRLGSNCPSAALDITLRPNIGLLGPFPRSSEVQHVRPGSKDRPSPLCTFWERSWARPWSRFWVQLCQSCLTRCVKTKHGTTGPPSLETLMSITPRP